MENENQESLNSRVQEWDLKDPRSLKNSLFCGAEGPYCPVNFPVFIKKFESRWYKAKNSL